MNTNDSTLFDPADIQILFSETGHPRSQINRITMANPSGPRPSRRLLRKLLRMRAALSSDF